MFKRYSINLEHEDRSQYIVGFLILLVYIGALLFPLMDKDAAHHANIALHMLQYNDYVSLVDRQMDYLDKPHFLFWTSAMSFKIFGVNTFAYRLPAILFALVSVYSTYRLAKHLSNKTTAKLAALMLASAQGFILSINDARMETPLAAAIIFGLWQLVVYIDTRKTLNLVLAALGTAIAFSTKGWIGPVIIFISAFIHIASSRKWRILASPKTWIFIPLLFLFISPVLYAYYLQFDKHPEKVIRNMSNISGVKFILWDQNFERFGGDNFIKGGRNSSVFFLYHTFLWAFFPWCIIAYVALFYWLRRMIYKRKWRNPFNFAALAFAFILFTISFSKFKMPHYIFMLMPLAAIFTAPYLRLVLSYRKGLRFYYPLQLVCAFLVLAATIVLNYYFFPPRNILVQVLAPLMIIGLLVYIFKKESARAMKLIYVTTGFAIVFNLLLNYNFFPSLLQYQGGNKMVEKMRAEKIDIADADIRLVDVNAHSFDFYRGYNHDTTNIALLKEGHVDLKDKYFLITPGIGRELTEAGLTIEPVVTQLDYNVARMKLKFLNPKTRAGMIDSLQLARIYKR